MRNRRIRLSLRVALPLVVLLIGLVIIAVATGTESLDSRSRAVERASEDLASTKSFVSNDLEAALRMGEDSRLAAVIGALNRDRDVALAMLVAPDGEVVAATDARWVNEPVLLTPAAAWARRIESTAQNDRSQQLVRLDERRLIDLSPLSWRLAPGELIASSQGTLVIVYDLSRILGESRRDLWRRFFVLLGIVCVAVIVLLYLLDVLFVQRMKQLATFASSGIEVGTAPPGIGHFEDELWTIRKALAEAMGRVRRQLLALRVSEQRFRSIVEGSSDWVFETNMQGRITFSNSGCERVLGIKVEEVQGRSLSSFFGTGTHSLLPPLCSHERHELEELPAEGDAGERLVNLILQPGGGAGMPQVFYCVCSDVTESHKLQQMQRQSQKLELVGQLAGGVAHDYNNLVGVMMGHCELLLMDEDLGADQRQSIEEIMECCQRSAELTRRLLAFGRRQVVETKRVDLREVVRESCRLLNRLVDASIRLDTQLAEDPLWVEVDPAQLEQVIVNLVINARDAMPQGGVVAIRCSSLQGGGGFDEQVQLVVEDTGSGMTQETLERVFEPFFTTKPSGKGTGLGLSTALGIVEQCRGTMHVQSSLGDGSCFEVRLPLAEAPSSEVVVPVPPRTLAGDERILVVDDRDDLRSMIVAYLKSLGYDVRHVSSVSEALREVEREKPTLALLDVVLAEGTGVELGHQIQERWPGVIVRYMSGYAAHLELEGRLLPGVNFLRKPFSLEELAEFLRRALDEPREDANEEAMVG